MYGLGLAKGMLVTLRHFFRPPVTVQFPEEVRPIPARARTNLLWFDERCTGCSTCAQACPDGCILVATDPRPDGSLEKVRYEIDPQNPYPDEFTGHVRVILRDGKSVEERQAHFRGGAQEPLSRTAIEAKFFANAAFGGWPRERAAEACDLVGRLFDGAVDLGALRG